MLQGIRDKTQGWLAGIVITLLILTFALWGIHSYFTGGSVSTTVAEVNGVDISKGQLALTYERMRKENQDTDISLKARALQALINTEVLKQASIKQNFYISQRQIDGFLASMPEFQVNGQFAVNRFQQILAATLYTPNDFLDLIKTSLLIDQPRLGLIFTSFALPDEIDNTVSLINQERDIQYMILPLQILENQAIQISPEQITDYYQQHQTEFKTPEQVSIEYVELSIKNIMNHLNVSNEELENFYKENMNTFAEPAKWKIEKLIVPVPEKATSEQIQQAQTMINQINQQAKAGKSLNQLAQQYHFQQNNNESNNTFLVQSQLPAELHPLLQTLKHPGDISKPARVNKGFIIIKAIDYKEAAYLPFSTVKDKIKDAVLRQKASDLFAEETEKLANITYEHPESLQAAAQQLDLPIQTSELFAKNKAGSATDISSNNKVREAAFSDDVLNLQNNSDVIQKNADTIIVLRLKSHIPESLLSLKLVQSQILDKLKAAKVDANLLQLANQIKDQIEKNGSADQLISQYKLTWQQGGFLTRHSNQVDPAISDTAFDMPKPTKMPITYAVAKIHNGYVIIGLKGVKEGKLKNPDESDIYSEQIQNTQGLLEYELYKQSMIQQAKIKYEN